MTETPRIVGRVVGIYTAPARSEAMRAHESIDAVAGRGLVGDRYHDGLGTFSARSPIVTGSRALSIIDMTTLDICRQRLGDDIPAALLRRNLLIDGLDIYALRERKITIGTVDIRVAGRCAPCRYLSRLLDADMLNALYRLGGMRAAIVRSGRFAVGDSVLTQ